MSARLPNGPPVFKIEVRFSEKELEFIRLRYERCLSLKEVATAMGITHRTAKWYSESIISRLGFHTAPGDRVPTTIHVTKLLVRYKIISVEDV